MTVDPLIQNNVMDLESDSSPGALPTGKRRIIGVIISVFVTLGIAAIWVPSLLDAIKRPSPVVTSMNNLRQILLAELVFESSLQTLPVDDHGLSWRVHIMNFMQQDGINQYLKLDEPWDSPTNIEWLSKMPEEFRSPGHAEVASSKTAYLRPIGNGAFPEEGKIKLNQIRDGVSNTILVAEYNPDEALNWMKPGDFCFDPDHPKQGLGKTRKGKQFLVVFADGSTHRVTNDIDPEILKSAFTIDSGDGFRGF